jgi:hypothetical protein
VIDPLTSEKEHGVTWPPAVNDSVFEQFDEVCWKVPRILGPTVPQSRVAPPT